MKKENYEQCITDSPMRFTEEQLKLVLSRITGETKVIICGEEEKIIKVK